MRRRRWFVVGLFVVLAVSTFLLLRRPPQTPLLPLEVGIWYWHQPFRLKPAEMDQLRAMGVRQLFVRAGTFRRDGERVRLVLPQQWESKADGFDIHLVFNFDYDIVRAYAKLSNETLAPSIVEVVQRERKRAERAGLHVAGLQFDFDCPTSRLPLYADLLQRLRTLTTSSPNPCTLSITALPTWFTSTGVKQVMAAVDFTVPQYYEAQVPKTLGEFATISRLRSMERGLKAVERNGLPFYVGLPAYGHALVYDEQDKLLGMYRDMDARETLRQPDFKLVRSFGSDASGKPAALETYIGEDVYDFQAPSPDRNGKNYHLVYDVPTPALVAQHLAAVRKNRPRNCRGVILFRYPEAEETQTLPLHALAAVLRGEAARPQLSVRFETAAAPWELIETGRKALRPPLEVTLVVQNTGGASTFIAPEAVTLTLAFDQAGLDAVPPRDFDTAETFLASSQPASFDPSTAMRASPRRANLARFHRSYLAAGQTVRIGPILLPADGATKVSGSWSAVGPGGFETVRGNISEVALKAKE